MTAAISPSAESGAPTAGGKARESRLRRFLAIDTRESFITLAQTAAGQLLITFTAMLAVTPYFGTWEAALAVGGAMMAAARPSLRDPILFAATWMMTFIVTGLGENDSLDNITAVLQQERVFGLSPTVLAIGFLLLLIIAVSGALNWVRHAPQSILARRPLLTLLTLETLLCSLASLDLMQGLPKVMLWTVVFTLTPYLWFLPYAIVDVRSRTPSSPLMQLAALRPFWNFTYLPFGKGAAFLRKHLSRTPRELAITQLKAVKLLLWANALFAVRAGLIWIFETRMQIPTVGQALDAFLGGQPYPLVISWVAMIVSTAKYCLKIASWAHLFIGIARLAGYRLPRGSWRPLESRTLMDYFNRFHYYFKELLVDFFFIPTFFKMFRHHPRLRMFFATFMAAGVGNAIWHFSRDINLIATLGPAAAFETYTSYAFYCLVLAIAVGISQVRITMGIRPSPTAIGRLYSFLFIWSFVVCMHVFSDESRNRPFGERLSFLISLFGVS
jgi:D-alanyl-lipoteichoic acid acyltransferase DltB (MBOAT superfamily)